MPQQAAIAIWRRQRRMHPGAGVTASGALPRVDGMGRRWTASRKMRWRPGAGKPRRRQGRPPDRGGGPSQTGWRPRFDRATLNLDIEPDRAIVRYSQSIENNTGEGLIAEAHADTSQARLTLDRLEIQIRQQVGTVCAPCAAPMPTGRC